MIDTRGAFSPLLLRVCGRRAGNGGWTGSNVRANGIVVVTHLDIIPPFVDQAFPVLVTS